MGLKVRPRTEEYRVDSGPLFGETVGVLDEITHV
jgi:hypothetical protein